MKNIVITGASRGIGLSLSKHYKQKGHKVHSVCRQASAELDALGVHIIDGIDVADAVAVKKLAKALANVEIDLLINNAGLWKDEVLGSIDFDSIQAQMEVNAYGSLRVSEALQNNFTDNAKIAMITSRMGSITDNTSGGRYGYRMSKAALNIAAVSLGHDLSSRGVAVAIIHPGLVGTQMVGGVGDITPDQAATRIVQRIDDLTLETSGSFWHSNGERLPW